MGLTPNEIDALVAEVPEGERVEIREYLHMDPSHQRISTHRRALQVARDLDGLRGHIDDRFRAQDEHIDERFDAIIAKLDQGWWSKATYPVVVVGVAIAGLFGRDIPRP